MTPQTWIALASLAAAMFIQAATIAFVLGRLFQDVATLKTVGPERAVQGLAIGRLEVQVTHLAKQMDAIEAKIDDRLAFLQAPPVYQPQQPQQRRRRSSPPAE